MSRRVGFLAANQPIDAKPSRWIPKDEANTLVSDLLAERISQKLIRAFAPGSVFRVSGPVVVSSHQGYGSELPGLRFVPPASQNSQTFRDKQRSLLKQSRDFFVQHEQIA